MIATLASSWQWSRYCKVAGIKKTQSGPEFRMATCLLNLWNEKSKRVYSNLVDLPLETDLEMLLLQGELMNKLI